MINYVNYQNQTPTLMINYVNYRNQTPTPCEANSFTTHKLKTFVADA